MASIHLSAYFSRESGTFTAHKAGTSTITCMVGSISVTYDHRGSGLPSAGQNFAWVWALGAALVLGGNHVGMRKRMAHKGISAKCLLIKGGTMKKRILALVLCALTILCILPVTAMAADTWDGTSVDTSWYNTTDTTFTISTGAQLAGLAVLVNAGATESGGAPVDFSGKTITLDADIDLGSHPWTPIGIYQPGSPAIVREFSGTFDGDGHTVSNLAIGTADSPENTLYMAGLFGEAYGASFKNLSLESVSIYSSYSDAYVGALAGEVSGTVENCSSSGNVSCSSSNAFVGGLVSFSVGNLKNCHSSCDVISSGAYSYAGGLISQIAGSSITNCYATGDVTGSDYVGGLVGDCAGSVSNSYATGDVTCSGYSGGGFAGYTDQAAHTISNCYATGDVSATGDDSHIGGFMGYTNNTITNCFATGSVGSAGKGNVSTVNVGGFVGFSEGTITRCFASGSVTGADTSYIGGFSGFNTSTINDCYASGSVASTGSDCQVGGLVGRNGTTGSISRCYARGAVSGTGYKGAVVGAMSLNATCTDCYYDTGATGSMAGIGYNPNSRVTTGLTTDKMTGIAPDTNMTALDYTSIWAMKANDSKWYFPQLAVLAGSSDDTIKAASLASVTLTPFTVAFNSNSGSAVASEYGYYSAVSEPTDPTRDGHVFDGWYTTSGLTTAYDFSTAVTADVTLHAKWTELTLASSDTDGKIYTDGRVTLTPSVAGGTWTFDSAYFSREDGTFTALKAGTSTITYTMSGVSKSYEVTIEASELPSTGQDFTWVWLLAAGAALAAAIAGAKIRKFVAE